MFALDFELNFNYNLQPQAVLEIALGEDYVCEYMSTWLHPNITHGSMQWLIMCFILEPHRKWRRVIVAHCCNIDHLCYP